MSYSYSKDFRLKSSKQYEQVLERGKSVRGKFITIYAYINASFPYSKLGVVASKKYGKAVDRNRFKRITREAFRKIKSVFPTGTQLIVKPRRFAMEAKMHDVLDELLLLSKEITEEHLAQKVSS